MLFRSSTIATLIPRARTAEPFLPTKPAVARELLEFILEVLEDGKAEEIIMIDLAGKTTIADYMVIASGRSARQVQALA